MAIPAKGAGSAKGHGSATRLTGRGAPQPTSRASAGGLKKTPKDAAPKRFGRGR